MTLRDERSAIKSKHKARGSFQTLVRINMKKLILFSLLLISVSGCMSPDGQMYPKTGGQLVMYGDLPHSEIEEKQKSYIEQETAKFGTREDASQAAAKAGWEYVAQAQSSRNYASINLAVRTFNGAWILWENNYQAFWGFGVCSSMREEYDKAEKYFLKAIDLNKNNPNSDLKLDLALTYTQSGNPTWHDKSIAVIKDVLNTASVDNYAKGYAYFIWAQALANKGDFQAAWEKVALSENLKEYKIPPEFKKQLERVHPRIK